MSTRRSSRSAYKSLVELEKRAKAAEAAAEGPLWGQEAFVEDDDDDGSFDAEKMSDDGEDIIDSDFDEPEDVPAPDDEVQAEKEVRRSEKQTTKKARTGKYVDPALKANRGQAPSNRPQKKAKKASETENASASNNNIHRSSLRRSTKIASMRAAEEREKRQVTEAERRKKKAAREAEKPEVRVLTQKEMLEEAKITEEKNKESLKELLRLEEEKKRLPPPKKKSKEPVMSVKSSKDGKQTVSFTSKDTDARKAMFPHLY